MLFFDMSFPIFCLGTRTERFCDPASGNTQPFSKHYRYTSYRHDNHKRLSSQSWQYPEKVRRLHLLVHVVFSCKIFWTGQNVFVSFSCPLTQRTPRLIWRMSSDRRVVTRVCHLVPQCSPPMASASKYHSFRALDFQGTTDSLKWCWGSILAHR